MANSFGADILIQAQDPESAASFYVSQLGFAITGEAPNMISLHGEHTKTPPTPRPLSTNAGRHFPHYPGSESIHPRVKP
jgi:hypothetical protein